MTSLQIKYFLKVAETMSFSRAASELYVSQPSVSRQLRLLEEELGYELFDRRRKNLITLTSAGLLFRDSFREAEKGFEKARAAARELQGHNPLRLRLGVGSGWDLAEPLCRFRDRVLRRYPQAELHFECGSFRVLMERMKNRELDAILRPKTSIVDFTDLEILPALSMEPRAYVRRGLLRPEGEELSIEDFSGQTLLMLDEEESPLAVELVQMQFQAQQVTVTPRCLPNRESILQAVLMGEGFTVFDQYMHFRYDPRLCWFGMEELIPLCLVQNKGSSNPLTHWLMEELSAEDGRAEE